MNKISQERDYITHIHMYIHTNICTQAITQVGIYVCMCIYVCMYVMYLCIKTHLSGIYLVLPTIREELI